LGRPPAERLAGGPSGRQFQLAAPRGALERQESQRHPPVVLPDDQQHLRPHGVSKEEIEAIRKEMKEKGGFVKQYLRWTHEAIVVGVEELIDGKYVLTFETGQIGLNLRRHADLRGNRGVFVGYVPESEHVPEALAEKLDRDLILPSS